MARPHLTVLAPRVGLAHPLAHQVCADDTTRANANPRLPHARAYECTCIARAGAAGAGVAQASWPMRARPAQFSPVHSARDSAAQRCHNIPPPRIKARIARACWLHVGVDECGCPHRHTRVRQLGAAVASALQLAGARAAAPPAIARVAALAAFVLCERCARGQPALCTPRQRARLSGPAACLGVTWLRVRVTAPTGGHLGRSRARWRTCARSRHALAARRRTAARALAARRRAQRRTRAAPSFQQRACSGHHGARGLQAQDPAHPLRTRRVCRARPALRRARIRGAHAPVARWCRGIVAQMSLRRSCMQAGWSCRAVAPARARRSSPAICATPAPAQCSTAHLSSKGCMLALRAQLRAAGSPAEYFCAS